MLKRGHFYFAVTKNEKNLDNNQEERYYKSKIAKRLRIIKENSSGEVKWDF